MSFLGTLPQWISAGGLVTLIGIMLRYELGKRKLDLADTSDIRDHYATEIAALRGRIVEVETHYRRMLNDVDRAHEECKRDREIDREEIRALRIEIDGLKRQMSRYSVDKLTILEDRAPEATKAAERIRQGSK